MCDPHYKGFGRPDSLRSFPYGGIFDTEAGEWVTEEPYFEAWCSRIYPSDLLDHKPYLDESVREA